MNGEKATKLDDRNEGSKQLEVVPDEAEIFNIEPEEEMLDDQHEDEETSEPSDEEYDTAEEEPNEDEGEVLKVVDEPEVKLWMGSIARFNAPRSKIF